MIVVNFLKWYNSMNTLCIVNEIIYLVYYDFLNANKEMHSEIMRSA